MGRPGSVPPASPGVGTRDGADAFCLGVLQDNTSPGIFETGPTAVAEPGSPTAGGRLRDDDNFDEEGTTQMSSGGCSMQWNNHLMVNWDCPALVC